MEEDRRERRREEEQHRHNQMMEMFMMQMMSMHRRNAIPPTNTFRPDNAVGPASNKDSNDDSSMETAFDKHGEK